MTKPIKKTKLKPMKSAPRTAQTDILALFAKDSTTYWTVVYYVNGAENDEVWHSDGEWYKDDDFAGWVDLPEIPQ